MKINIFLDDSVERIAPEGFIYARNIDELKELFQNYEVGTISLDHDLGVDKNGNILESGYDFVKFFCSNGLYCEKICIHSHNPVGVASMYETLKSSQKRGFISNSIIIENPKPYHS